MRAGLSRSAIAGVLAAVVTTAAVAAGAASGSADAGHHPAAAKGKAKLNLVFVLDGLRPDSISVQETPNLYRLREGGVEFTDSHAAVPTVTRVNSPVIGSGNWPETNGIVGNSMFVPAVSATGPFSTGSADQLTKLDDVTGGKMMTSTTLGERLQAAGKSLVALGSGSSGSTLLLNPRAPRGVGTMINVGDISPVRPFTYPATLGEQLRQRFGPPPTSSGNAKVDYAERVLREYVLTDLEPTVVLNWFTEPDGSQHQFGAGSPQARETIRNDDRNIGLILDRLRALGLIERTNIIVTSDHGFSLHDFSVNVKQELIDAGLKSGPDSDDVVVAETGSVSLHVKHRDPARIRKITAWLQQQPWADAIYTKGTRRRPYSRGSVRGTFSLELIHQAHPTRRPDILLTLPWTSKPNAFGVVGTSTTPGGGATGPLTGPESGHGSFSPHDIHNTLLAWGVDFKDGIEARAPAGNVDITPTLLALAGVRGGEPTDGRVLREALAGGPRTVPFRKRTYTVKRGRRYAAQVTVSEVGAGGKVVRYVDQSRRLK